MASPLEQDQLTANMRSWLMASAMRDAAAFRQLYEASSAKLFGFALRILNKQELAEEAMQEAFVSIWHNAASYQPHLAAPMTWMATIVRNKAFDLLRRMDNAVELDAETFDPAILAALEDPAATPAEKLALSADARILAGCFAKLEGLHRQVIALAFYHDLSHTEVATHMALPTGTVKTWIRRGLERLKGCIAKGGGV